MAQPSRIAPFINVVAVDAWDAWFRWREDGRLRDVSIEDTWSRVARALAGPERCGVARGWEARFLDCLAEWCVLPDPRVLAQAGTPRPDWGGAPLVASLNAAALVQAPGTPQARVDATRVAECARRAVRMLDNAALVSGIATGELRIGVVGLADALLLLDRGYDTVAGRTAAVSLCAALYHGCLDASIRLARERGAASPFTIAIPRRACRTVDPGLRRDAGRHGVRHVRLTAITSQARLALFANHVSDALDPVHGRVHPHRIAAPAGTRTLRSAGYALDVMPPAWGARGTVRANTLAHLPWQAQVRLRAAIQPWIDVPISYPLLLPGAESPSPAAHAEAVRLAVRHGLGEPAWRNTERADALDA